MEKLTARSYIEERIQTTRTRIFDRRAEKLSTASRKSQAEHAQYQAQRGNVDLTASFLKMDSTLSVSQKGKILAEAFTSYAERTEDLARYTRPDSRAERDRRDARKMKKIAQGLTRASKRA